MNQKVYWYRKISNGYEPDNLLRIEAEVIDGVCIPYALSAVLNFSDGISQVSIIRNENRYHWVNDNKSGVVETFEQAVDKMPAYVTDADYYEDLELHYVDPV